MNSSKKLIAPSILACDFGKLANEVAAVDKAGCDWIHVDVMDGHFVPNLTIGPCVVKAIRKATKLPLDVHLMIENPQNYIANFAKAGADILTVHIENTPHLHRIVQSIKDHQMKACVAINPATSIDLIDSILADLDMVLIMSVNPGFGGQKFINSSLAKVQKLKQKIKEKNLNTLIEIDGGIHLDTIGPAAQAGVDVFVAGSAIYNSNDYQKTITQLREKIG